MKKLNLNDVIKVKLTDYGKDVYYHQYDELIAHGAKIEPAYPRVDADGYTEFQLWVFMDIFGSKMGLGYPNVINPINIYINDDEVEKCEDEKKLSAFDKVFRPEKQWADMCLTDANPCEDCGTFKRYLNEAMYGTIAERGHAELPEYCKTCIQKIRWEVACLQKLAWYERNDERLRGKRKV